MLSALKDTVLMPAGWPMQGGLGNTAGLAGKVRLRILGVCCKARRQPSTKYAVRSGILSTAAGRLLVRW